MKLERIGAYLLAVLVLGFAVKAYWLWMAELVVDANPTLEGYAEALTWNPGSDEYHAIRGASLRSSLDKQDLEAAVAEFEKAIALNPRIWLHHLDLAVTHELLGDFEATKTSFAEALRLNPHNTGLRWQVANFYLRRADLAAAMREFRAAVELDPSRLKLAANRLQAMGVSVEDVAEELVPSQRAQLLDFLYFVLGQSDLESERAAGLAWGSWERWQLAPAEESFRIRSLFRFIDSLLRRSELERAAEVWEVGLRETGEVEKQEVVRQSEEVAGRRSQVAGQEEEEAGRGVVFNGGFESRALLGGLDWVLPNHAEVYYEEDYRTRFQGLVSLRIDFSGTSNLNYRGLRQNLILPAGELQLDFVAMSENITSDQGIYFEIRSYPGNQLLARSDAVRGDQSWRRISTAFRTDRPMAASLALRRDPSKKFDNLLGGSLWLDEIQVGVAAKE